MAGQILSFRDLRVYQKMFNLQQDIFEASKTWPKEEKYALTDQVRRSSRSVGASIAESWAKRRYPPHFVSKLTDADGELQETSHWLSTALECQYITAKQYIGFETRLKEIGRMIGKMMSMPDSFTPKPAL